MGMRVRIHVSDLHRCLWGGVFRQGSASGGVLGCEVEGGAGLQRLYLLLWSRALVADVPRARAYDR